MSIDIKYRIMGFLVTLALVFSGGIGCDMSEDSAGRDGTLGGSGAPEDGGFGDDSEYETRAVDPLIAPSAQQGAMRDIDGELSPVGGCAPGVACHDWQDTQAWCGLGGVCEAPADEVDSEEAEPSGEPACQPLNEGVEICDGVDDNCDGWVDNIYAGGHLSARDDLTCVTSRAGALRCMGSGQAVGRWPATPARLGQVSAGGEHGCALGADAKVYCWGGNAFGQASPGGPDYVGEPTHVALNAPVRKVGSGAHHSCALTQPGQIYCWGRNQYSQFGNGTSTPHDGTVEIAAELNFVDLSLGADHACAVTDEGLVLCWGANHYGQTAQPDLREINVPAWVDIPGFVTQISAGNFHTCAVTEQERVYCWGQNEHGQLGDETIDSRRHPQVAGEEFLLASVSAGGTRTCGVTSGGGVYCWGNNALGSLGVDGSQALYTWPTTAAGALRFATVEAGGEHTCGLTLHGYLLCWGRGQEGQLGGGAQTQKRQPRQADCD